MKRTLVLVGLMAVAGCSSTSFVGSRFDNFTAYYNTFYNARKAYSDAVKAMQQAEKPVDRDTYLLVIDPGTRGTGTRDFENAIKKSADVLRGHPDSKWVDDALLLIGKSYYYQGNTVGAQQKFREVIDRQSGLEDEARFWLGLALISGGALDEGAAHLLESLDRDGVSRKWAGRMRLALGELYVRQQEWEKAVEQLASGVSDADDDKLRSRAQFLLGQVLETVGRYEQAAQAYRDVERFKPTYELSYAAKFNATRVEGEHGDSRRALQDLRKMVRDDKNFAYRGQLEYLRARILQADRRADEALGTFYDVLYDSDASITSIRGRAHYQLGLLFRDQYVDFDRAAAHFDTAATSLARGGRNNTSAGRVETLAPAPNAITDAQELADVFGKYAEFHAEVEHYDSLLALGALDDEAFRTRIEEIRVQMAEEIVLHRRSQERRAAEAGFRGKGAAETGSVGANNPSYGTGAPGSDYSTAGFLYHRDRSRVQDGLLSFFDRWGERPLVPNWRRSAAITGSARSGENEDETTGEEAVAAPAAGQHDITTEALLGSVDVDMSSIPRTPERQADMRRQRAAARYELANVLFLSIGMPDSAAAWYRRVLDEAAEPDLRARALYALAEVQRSLGDLEAAAAIYRRVLNDHPDSEVASRAAERLGVSEPRVTVDESVTLSRAYQKAFDLWMAGSFDEGIRGMLRLAAGYPDSLMAARALLAASAIYVDRAGAEGLDLTGPLDLTIPDSMWTALGLMDSETVARPESDSTATDTDRVGVQPDSSITPPAADLPDSAAVDSSSVDLQKPAEGNGGPPETVAATPPDSTGADSAADTLAGTAAPPDSTAGERQAEGGENEIFLIDLYHLVSEKYPGSEYARRASVLAREMEIRMAPPEATRGFPADSTQAAEDSTQAAESAAGLAYVPDKERSASEADSTAAHLTRPGLREEVEAGRADRPSLRGEDRLEPQAKTPGQAADTTVYDSADAPAILVGGQGALQRMFRYPETAVARGVSGTVQVRFVVDKRGRVVDPQVVDSVGSGCDREALRVTRLSRFRPAMLEGRPVRFRMSIDVACAPPKEP